MSVLKLAKKYIIDSQIYVSLMGTMLAAFFFLEQNTFRFPKLYLIFLTFFSGYLYTKYQGQGRIFKKILIFNFFTGVICILLIIRNHNEIVLLKWLLIVVLGLLYNSNFLANTIRNIPFVKIFYVGLVWALSFGFLGLPEVNWPIIGFSFFFISALVLPFDIRDMKYDTVVTFPKLIGIKNTKLLAYFLIILANIISILFFRIDSIIALSLTSIVSCILIFFASETKTDAYFSFWIESCSALPLIIYLAIKYYLLF